MKKEFDLMEDVDHSSYCILDKGTVVHRFKSKDRKSAKKVLKGFKEGFEQGLQHIPNLDALAVKYGYDRMLRIMQLILDEDVSGLGDPVKYMFDKLIEVLDLPKYECPYSKVFKEYGEDKTKDRVRYIYGNSAGESAEYDGHSKGIEAT